MRKFNLILMMAVCWNWPAYANCDTTGKCVWDCSPNGKTNTCTATFENGTLSISGTDMKDYGSFDHDGNTSYSITNAPWNDAAGHIKQITNVVIGSEMKNIGAHFLSGATALEHITIPNNIESIGFCAFYHTGLKTVDWQAPFKNIGSESFQYTHLTDLSFLEGIETIPYGAFNGDFLYNDSPTSLIIPDSVKTIDRAAFTSNFKLQSIILGENVTSIDSGAFPTSLQTIYCTGNIDVCKANVGEAWAGIVKQATFKKINGKTYIFDENGKLFASSGKRLNKRIYTIDEATIVSKPTGNKLMLRYK